MALLWIFTTPANLTCPSLLCSGLVRKRIVQTPDPSQGSTGFVAASLFPHTLATDNILANSNLHIPRRMKMTRMQQDTNTGDALTSWEVYYPDTNRHELKTDLDLKILLVRASTLR